MLDGCEEATHFSAQLDAFLTVFLLPWQISLAHTPALHPLLRVNLPQRPPVTCSVSRGGGEAYDLAVIQVLRWTGKEEGGGVIIIVTMSS